MLDIDERIERANNSRREIVDRINRLNEENQNCLQELLRLDGELRCLRELKEDSLKNKKSKNG